MGDFAELLGLASESDLLAAADLLPMMLSIEKLFLAGGEELPGEFDWGELGGDDDDSLDAPGGGGNTGGLHGNPAGSPIVFICGSGCPIIGPGIPGMLSAVSGLRTNSPGGSSGTGGGNGGMY